MKSFLVCLMLIATGVVSLPVTDVPRWTPPGPGDVRSPCPLLNSLANHNFLPHNGKNCILPILIETFRKYINTGADVASLLGPIGFTTNPLPNAQFFDLDNIDKHNVIEHDGSLSRGDAIYGDDHSFNLLAYSDTKSFFTGDTIDIPTAAKARFERMTPQKLLNPRFNLTEAGLMGSFLESSFYFSVFGDPFTGVATTRWVIVFFQEERLPFAEGWAPRKLETNLTTLGVMAQKVMASTPPHSLSM